MSDLINLRKISVWSIVLKVFLFMVLNFIVLLLVDFTLNIDVVVIIDSFYSLITYIGIIYILFQAFNSKGIESKFIIGNTSLRNVKWGTYLSLQLFLTLFSILAVLALLYTFTGVYENFIQEVLDSTTETHLNSVWALFLSLIVAIVLAPIAEELFFRGFLLNRWGVTIGLGKAMIISSFIFSIVHFNKGFIGQFIFGMFACLIYIKTKKLIIPIIMHGLNNLIATSPNITDFIFQEEPSLGLTPGELEQFYHYVQVVLSIGTISFIISTPFIIYLFYRLYPKGPKITPSESNKLSSCSGEGVRMSS